MRTYHTKKDAVLELKSTLAKIGGMPQSFPATGGYGAGLNFTCVPTINF